MARICGKNAKVMYGSVTVAEMVEWSMSGFSTPIAKKDTAFGDTFADYEACDVPEAGTITFSGNYDPADTNGQVALNAACVAGSHLTDLYLYANTSTFWRVGSGGYIIINKAQSVTMPRNNFGKITFEGTVCAAAMEQVGSGS